MWKPGQIVTIARTKYRVKAGRCFFCKQCTLKIVDEPCRTCSPMKWKRTKQDKNFYLEPLCGNKDNV